ncbi:MAG: thermonuclease family protein [Devosia sp.]
MLRENTADTLAEIPSPTVAAAWLREGEALARNFYRKPGFPRGNGRRRLLPRLAPLLVLALVALAAAVLAPPPDRIEGLARAADGDSLAIGGERVRLVGLDAPERDQICKDGDGMDWACGAEALHRLSALVSARTTLCEGDERDRYGRLLATCTVEGRDIGLVLVAEGLALDSGPYGDAERAARADRKGIWGGEFVTPRRWRDEGPEAMAGESWLDRLMSWLGQLTR